MATASKHEFYDKLTYQPQQLDYLSTLRLATLMKFIHFEVRKTTANGAKKSRGDVKTINTNRRHFNFYVLTWKTLCNVTQHQRYSNLHPSDTVYFGGRLLKNHKQNAAKINLKVAICIQITFLIQIVFLIRNKQKFLEWTCVSFFFCFGWRRTCRYVDTIRRFAYLGKIIWWFTCRSIWPADNCEWVSSLSSFYANLWLIKALKNSGEKNEILSLKCWMLFYAGTISKLLSSEVN